MKARLSLNYEMLFIRNNRSIVYWTLCYWTPQLLMIPFGEKKKIERAEHKTLLSISVQLLLVTEVIFN